VLGRFGEGLNKAVFMIFLPAVPKVLSRKKPYAKDQQHHIKTYEPYSEPRVAQLCMVSSAWAASD
jgi:hypothetical protein